ncbi:transketolase [Sphingobacterium corticibacterium]|uniref:Transketolase n=2 Tax=Sphingobacterium corticibacterium TaxID=2484746 RepID=A0A4Q6XSI0_9SPHI|nr:transketolase [Sphingobacterium corticibacterium]RZF60424.1 transketolase [Sphingobacterium corticibacterium]
MTKNSIHNLEEIASQVRRDIVRMVHACQSGHPGGSLGCTELLVSLYFEVMDRKEGFDVDGIGEDLFFLSNGHISPVFYSVLGRSGYFPVEELATFRKINSRVQGHPTTHEGLPGIRISSGSLGQGLSVAIGAAQAKKLNSDDSFIFVLMGDGELQEGQIWEAALYAPHNKMDNLIAIVDYNGAQIDGPTAEILSLGNLRGKWEAFGWNVLDIERGNHMQSVVNGLYKAKELSGNGRPTVILLHTEMGHGVDFMMGSHKWHGVAPNDDQLASALGQNRESLGDY